MSDFVVLLLCSCAHSKPISPKVGAVIRFKGGQVEIIVYGNKTATQKMIEDQSYFLARVACGEYKLISFEIVDVDKKTSSKYDGLLGKMIIECVRKKKELSEEGSLL